MQQSERAFSSVNFWTEQATFTSSIGTLYGGNANGGLDLSGGLQKQLTLRTSAGSAFSGCVVQASPDGLGWENVDGTTFTTLGTGVTKSGFYQDRRRFWRVLGSTTAGSVTVQSWWHV